MNHYIQKIEDLQTKNEALEKEIKALEGLRLKDCDYLEKVEKTLKEVKT